MFKKLKLYRNRSLRNKQHAIAIVTVIITDQAVHLNYLKIILKIFLISFIFVFVFGFKMKNKKQKTLVKSNRDDRFAGKFASKATASRLLFG